MRAAKGVPMTTKPTQTQPPPSTDNIEKEEPPKDREALLNDLAKKIAKRLGGLILESNPGLEKKQ
jgi:hypothetical protein